MTMSFNETREVTGYLESAAWAAFEVADRLQYAISALASVEGEQDAEEIDRLVVLRNAAEASASTLGEVRSAYQQKLRVALHATAVEE